MSFKSTGHNHEDCIKTAIQKADTFCSVRGARLTTIRRRVLELIWQSHQPVGAYELLEVLQNERRNAQPPTIYRALTFLLDLGLIHRVESLNAFVGCNAPGSSHSSQFLICSICGVAAEIEDERLDKAIRDLAKDAGFKESHRSIEVAGYCPNCESP